ncbi:MAG TPA: ARMT1-like domain-containing protein [Chitinivibrionales bacterium]|nr:ARMT1-like domain-containing protein [Chitinivibrionales bacterium]
MKFVPECLACFVDDITGALDMLHAPAAGGAAVLSESLAYLSGHIADGMPPSYYITELHRILKRRLGVKMPFARLRAACLKAGMAIARRVEKRASALSGERRFRYLVRWAIAANSLDFRTAGAGYGLTAARAEKTIAGYFRKGLDVDHCRRIHAAAWRAKSIVYIPDNVGELPFDKLLVGLLSSYGADVTVPLRGGPITSDAVMADARAAGMQHAASRLIGAGPDTLGISFREMSRALSAALSRADLVIAKGQANYYVLSEFGRRYPRATIACLFTAKCGPVWEKFGCSGKASIAAIIQNVKTGGNPK